MFENIELIRKDEDAKAYEEQKSLICRINKYRDPIDILRLAILQIHSLNNDWETAYSLVSGFSSDGFTYLVIGSYISDYVQKKNTFLQVLLDHFKLYTDYEKAIVLYLKAYSCYNSLTGFTKAERDELLYNLEEAILLNDQCPSFYELRYLIRHNRRDVITADNKRVFINRDDAESFENSLDPEYFISWYILHKYTIVY